VAICALGLAESGEKSDAAAIIPLAQCSSVRVRRAAVRALRRLDAQGMNAILLRVISSDVPAVAREAAFSLFASRIVPPSDIWSAGLENTDIRVRQRALRWMRAAGKWPQIQYYLRSAADPALQKCAVEMMWVREYDASFTQATAAEAQALAAMMDVDAEHLPRPLRYQLALIVKTIGP
jgi:HEAT repeat protein